VDRVHVSVDWLGVLGPPWTDVGADRGDGGMLTGAWPLGALVRQSSSGPRARLIGDPSSCPGPKSCLWELPYAKALILPHNIDLMHQEHNVVV
jgi:hypothetical protein